MCSVLFYTNLWVLGTPEFPATARLVGSRGSAAPVSSPGWIKPPCGVPTGPRGGQGRSVEADVRRMRVEAGMSKSRKRRASHPAALSELFCLFKAAVRNIC